MRAQTSDCTQMADRSQTSTGLSVYVYGGLHFQQLFYLAQTNHVINAPLSVVGPERSSDRLRSAKDLLLI